MAPEFPRKDELQERAVDGHPVTKTEVSSIAQEETDLTGRGPIKGGATSTAQSVQAKQQNYVEAAGDVSRKPMENITKEDAAEVQKAEVSFLRCSAKLIVRLTRWIGESYGRTAWKGVDYGESAKRCGQERQLVISLLMEPRKT